MIAFLIFIAVVGFVLATATAVVSIVLAYLLIWVFPLTLFQAALLIILSGLGLMVTIIAMKETGFPVNPYIDDDDYDDDDDKDKYHVVMTPHFPKNKKNKSRRH